MFRFSCLFKQKVIDTPIIYPNDVFLVSYPKSGNTWVRFLIANLLRKKNSEPTNFYNVHDYCPEWPNQKGPVNSIMFPRVFKSHQSYNPDFSKVIYIVRDPRDVYISYYHYLLPTLNKNLTLIDFINTNNFNYGRWSDHVASWLNGKQNHTLNFLIIHYEDLLKNPSHKLTEIASFAEIPASQHQIEMAINESSFEKMKSIEESQGRKFSTIDKTIFVRNGKWGQWRKDLGRLELEAIYRYEDKELIKRLGYLL